MRRVTTRRVTTQKELEAKGLPLLMLQIAAMMRLRLDQRQSFQPNQYKRVNLLEEI